MKPTKTNNRFRRDRAGIAAALVAIVCFTAYFFIFTQPLARAGCAIVVLSAALICRNLLRARPPRVEPSAGATLDPILEPLGRLENQRRSTLRAIWTNILPLILGLNVFCLGLPRPGIYKVILPIATVAITAIACWLTLRSLDRKIRLLRSQLETAGKLKP